MAKLKTETLVVGYLFDAQVWLEGQETKLAYDGDKTRKSTDVIEINDDELRINFHGVGVAGTEWELTINELQPTKRQLYNRKGAIKSTGHSLIEDSVELTEEVL
jgi:hypothetical protein